MKLCATTTASLTEAIREAAVISRGGQASCGLSQAEVHHRVHKASKLSASQAQEMFEASCTCSGTIQVAAESEPAKEEPEFSARVGDVSPSQNISPAGPGKVVKSSYLLRSAHVAYISSRGTDGVETQAKQAAAHNAPAVCEAQASAVKSLSAKRDQLFTPPLPKDLDAHSSNHC